MKMWFIISSSNPDQKHVVLGGRNFSIGRKECDILVTGDATVSRRHGELSMTHTESNVTNPSMLPVLLLKDLSKFGTWVNNQRVEGERILKDGDTVYFGSPKSTFMIVAEPLVVTTSCLDNAGRKSLQQILCTLGGHMVKEWTRDCGLLIMSRISVTIKVICALVSLKPVVTPGYLEAYLKYLQGSRDKPDPDLFTPDVAESQLDPTEVTFATNSQRKTLFQGKTFVFLSQKQFKKMSLAIELAGGTPLLMDRPGEVGLLTQPGTVVMSCTDQEASQQQGTWISLVEETLERTGKHMIADAELGYAVLYASTERHCNPDYAADVTLSRIPSQTMSQAEVYVPDTATQNRAQASQVSQNRKSRTSEVQRSQTRDATSTVPNDTGQRSGTEDDTLGASSEKSQRSRLKKSSSPTPAPEVRVKEEVPSQTATPQSSRKRTRKLVEQEDSDEDDFTSKRIKAEPVTPGKKTDTLKSGDKPQHAAANELDSDDGLDYSKIDIDESVSIPQRRTSPRLSPKQSPRTSPTRSRKEDNKRKTRSRSRSPHEGTKKTLVKEETLGFTVFNDDDECGPSSIKSKESRSNKRSDGSPPDGSKSAKSRAVTKCDGVVEDIYVREGRNSNRRDIAESDDETVQQAETARPSRDSHTVPAGFMTTVKSEKDPDVPVSVKTEVDEDLPRGCMQVEEVSLVVRRAKPKPVDAGSGDCPEGYTRWKGRIIRNFKKFRKTEHCGANKLPKIIGGSDLEVHQAQRSKELDDWMKESMQAESQHAREDEQAQAMFDYNPGERRRGR